MREGASPKEFPLLLAAALVPLAFGPWFWDMYVLPKMLLASWLLACAAILSVAARPGPGPASPSHVDAALAVLAGVALAAACVSLDPWVSWVGQYGYGTFGILGWALCFAAFYLCRDAEEGFRGRLLAWMAAGSVPVSLYALLQWGGCDPYPPTALVVESRAEHRPLSTLGGPVQLGAYLMLILIPSAHLARQGRALGAVALALGAAALAVTHTRSAWLGAVAGLWVYAFACGPWKGAKLKFAAGALTVLCLAGVLWLTAVRAVSDMERREVWKAAVSVFLERPWLGTGPDGFGTAFRAHRTAAYVAVAGDKTGHQDAHNDWLQILATLGAAGGAAYAWVHAGFFAALRRSRARGWSSTQAAMLGSLAALALQWKLNSATWASGLLAAMLAGALLAPEGAQAPLESGRRSWWGKGLVCLCSVAALACSGLSWADRQESLGLRARRDGRPREAAERLERAVSWNGRETLYRLHLANLLWDVASAAARRDRDALVHRAWQVAQEGALLRPRDPAALHLLAMAEMRRSHWGGEDRWEAAGLALDRASRLDPNFGPIVADGAKIEMLRRQPPRRKP